MAVQKEINLDQPVDTAATNNSLEVAPLTPEFSIAALTLHGDYYADLQAKYMRWFLWSLPVQSCLAVILGGYLYYCLKDYIEISDSYGEFFKLSMKSTDFRVSLILTFAALAVSLAVFGAIGMIVSDEFRVISKKLTVTNYIKYIFDFDLIKFAKLDHDVTNLKQKKLLDHGENSQLISYKGEPIAIITLKPLYDKSNDANLIIKITGMNVRKAFRKLDFEELLLNYAKQRSTIIYKQYLKQEKITKSNGCKITLLIDAYSFDNQYIQALVANGFAKVSQSYKLNPVDDNTAFLNGAISKVFGLSRDTYAIHIVDTNKDSK